MNIFYLDPDPRRCAQLHCDQHVVRMCVEYAQLLCSALHATGQTAPYRATHLNHPCAIWTRASLAHWRWLRALALELGDEYRYRYGSEKRHRSIDVVRSLTEPPLPDHGFVEPPQCMPEALRGDGTVDAYRRFYREEKARFATWRRRPRPAFMAAAAAGES